MIDALLEILCAKWLIDRNTAMSYLPILISLMNGQKFAVELQSEAKKRKQPYVLAIEEDFINPVAPYDITNVDIPENSVAVIPLDGVLCSWDTNNIIRYLHQANDNPRISSILFPSNTPGGMVFNTDICAQAIKDSAKPTVAAIMNMTASAGMWIASAMDYRIATSQLDRIGSIGVMTSLTDMAILLKDKLGIVITDFYATKSTKKNEMVREFQANPTGQPNSQPIIDELDYCNEIFHAEIQKNLGIKADSEVFTGAMYNANQAIDLGLINEINSLEYAFNYAYDLGMSNKINQFSKQLKF